MHINGVARYKNMASPKIIVVKYCIPLIFDTINFIFYSCIMYKLKVYADNGEADFHHL